MAADHLTQLLRKIRCWAQAEPERDLGDGELLERFVRLREEAAFALLLQRHGPMVLGVCRRVLRDLHAAEDAFQATFVVLVRRAASLVNRESLGNWLHGVALRVALRARSQSATRRHHEKRVVVMGRCERVDEATWEELRGILDEEIAALPERYRSPLVLHYLQGRTQAQTAAELKCPRSTLRDRLEQARELLRERLDRRGVALSAGALAALLAQQTAPAAVPALLTLAAVRAVTLGTLSATTATLVEETVSAAIASKAKVAAWLLLLLTTAAGGAVLAVQEATPPQRPASAQRLMAKSQPFSAQEEKDKRAETQAHQGRVEGRFTAADTGKPIAGATVRLLIQGMGDKSPTAEATSAADGRYSLTVPLGHCGFWGIYAPPGYYTQERKAYGSILTTATEPQVIRDFVLQPGSPWRVELHGVPTPLTQPPFFSAVRDPDREMFASGETIDGRGDAQGRAVLTIPTESGHYRFHGGLIALAEDYDIAPANLNIDQDFDPWHIQGAPEPVAERKAVRLRDERGRTATVEGVEVFVEAGQAVLRFQARRVPDAATLTLRGVAVDEAGKPVQGAQFTAAFASGNGAAMSHIKATTVASGLVRMDNLRLSQHRFDRDSRIRMVVVKSGYDGAETPEFKLRDLKQADGGDFGTVVLKVGRRLRGKVVDENGQPLHGALITNMTNYFLYGHLRCRTDTAGRFVMPDLSYGNQKIAAQYGERSGEEEFDFQENSGECVITARLRPKTGTRLGAAVRPRPARPVALEPPVGAWDLTPPAKEPKYQKEPRYALVVFGPKRAQRVWMVLDGTTLHVDRNANGDLTEPGERLEPNNPKDDSNRFAGTGMFTHFDIFEFTVEDGAGGSSKFRLEHWIAAERFTPSTDFDKRVHARRLELHSENATLWRLEGQGQAQTPVVFLPKPADAQVCALDGPLTFVRKLPEYQVLQRGEAGCDLAFHIAVIGRPHRGAEQLFYNPLATKEVPAGAHLEVEIEYPAKEANAPPLRRKHLLKQRC